jgi:hypothetical protein
MPAGPEGLFSRSTTLERENPSLKLPESAPGQNSKIALKTFETRGYVFDLVMLPGLLDQHA